jgi:hypothetical protein
VEVALAQSASSIVVQSLLQAAESARLQRLLKDAAKAISILEHAGYTRDYPGEEVPDERLSDWLAISKESLWISKARGMVVELHTAIVDNPYLLANFPSAWPLQTVGIPSGIELDTLAADELFAYLCVHGAWHGWARLKWLADVAALLSKCSAGEVERLYRSSVSLGAGRSSAQALLLCSDLLSLRLGRELETELRRKALNNVLEKLALNAMAGRGATELDRTVLGTVGINLAHLLLYPGFRYKASELGRKLVNPEDRFSLALPRHLRFLYPVMAVPRWIARRRRLSRS